MAPSKIKKAFGAVKDQTTISLAKVGSSTSLADLEVAIVKATKHNEHPAEEKYIREILSLTCYSRTYISACVTTISKRLNKTRSWTVAMKTLILIQRLLYEGDPAYEQEIFFSTRRGTRILNMSDFSHHGKSNSGDFSAYVRTYALYLDERLEYRMQNRRGKKSTFGNDEEEDENKDKEIEKDKDKEPVMRSTPVRDLKTEQIFSKMQHLQLLLERLLACRPTGAAKTHRIVIVSLYAIVKDSFQIYRDITEILSTFLERFKDLEMQDCIKVYDTFCRVGKQFDELELFYCWCKSMGIARSSEYPQIEKITSNQLEVMDQYIKDRLAGAQAKAYKEEEKNEEGEEEEAAAAKVEESEEDVHAIKALPPPEEEPKAEEVIEEPIKEEPKEQEQNEADLLHLGDDMPSTEEQGDKLALALFDGAAPATVSTTQALPWHAFDDEEADWETALVQSTSNLPNQKPELGGGFDTLLLDGMYKQAEVNAAMQGPGFGVSGSASSLALGSAGRPAMLALPAPPTSGGCSGFEAASTDPFAASLGVAPPSYVQMTDMEKKQRLLMEEQVLWQQYTREGMQGEATLSRLERNAYMGAHAQPNSGSNYR